MERRKNIQFQRMLLDVYKRQGNTRQKSVYNALQAVNNEYVLIHDGARPLIRKDTIAYVLEAVVEKDAVSVMTKTTDTIKEVDAEGRIIRTIDRSKLYNTQTPQGFKTSIIKEVHEKLRDGNFTDDCSMPVSYTHLPILTITFLFSTLCMIPVVRVPFFSRNSFNILFLSASLIL